MYISFVFTAEYTSTYDVLHSVLLGIKSDAIMMSHAGMEFELFLSLNVYCKNIM